MIIKKIPAGTKIYLRKRNGRKLSIQPDRVLTNDSLYVAYDVRVEGDTVIPRNTRVLADWVTESSPTIAAQLQVRRIFLHGAGQPIEADSDVIESFTDYNGDDVGDATYLYEQADYRASSNIRRRIVDLQCCVKTLKDVNRDSLYLEICTQEIPVTLIADFVAMPCLM